MGKRIRGLFAILTASFTEDLSRIDEEDIRRQTEFSVLAGAHGVVAPVNATEQAMLTFEERCTVVRLMVEQAAGRVPTVAGVQGPNAEIAAMHARRAKEYGADMVIAMGPYITQTRDIEQLRRYYGAIADASGLPVMLQNHDHNGQVCLSVEDVRQVMRSVPAVRWVKEETPDSLHVIRDMASQYPAEFSDFGGVFGGKGSLFMIEEHARGACGNMPACDIPDLSAKLWELLDGGKAREAGEWYRAIWPVIELEAVYKWPLYKKVLHARGVVKNTRWRQSVMELDARDEEKFLSAMSSVEPLFSVHADDIRL